MDFGAHLPLMDFGGNPYTLDHLSRTPRRRRSSASARCRSTTTWCSRCPWLDGPTALAAVIGHSGTMTLATTVSLAGRPRTGAAGQDAGRDRSADAAGGWSSPSGPAPRTQDFDARRISTSTSDGRASTSRSARCGALWRAGAPPFVGRFYSTEGSRSSPRRRGRTGRRSGSGAGARRPGCAASPAWPTGGWRRRTTRPRSCSPRPGRTCRPRSRASGKDPETFPNALATMWFYITDEPRRGRPRHARAGRPDDPPAGGDAPRAAAGRAARAFAEKLSAFARAGVQRVFIWPVADERRPARAVLGEGPAARRAGIEITTNPVAEPSLARAPRDPISPWWRSRRRSTSSGSGTSDARTASARREPRLDRSAPGCGGHVAGAAARSWACGSRERHRCSSR